MLLPVDWLLVRKTIGARCNDQGLHDDARRRCLHAVGSGLPLLGYRHTQLPGDLIQRACARDADKYSVRDPGPLDCRIDRPAALYWNGWKISAMAASCVASRRDGRTNSGLGHDPRGDDGFRRCLSHCALLPADHCRLARGRATYAYDARDLVHRCVYGALRGNDRASAERH